MSSSNGVGLSGSQAHEVEVMAKATRRRFTAEYKLQARRSPSDRVAQPAEIPPRPLFQTGVRRRRKQDGAPTNEDPTAALPSGLRFFVEVGTITLRQTLRFDKHLGSISYPQTYPHSRFTLSTSLTRFLVNERRPDPLAPALPGAG